jgi:hypothetical protein
MLAKRSAALTTERGVAEVNPRAGSPRLAEDMGSQDATGAVHMPGMEQQPAARPGPAASAALGRLTSMAYDRELADHIQRLIGSAPDLTEKKMFGGLAFLIAGNMAITASSHGGAMVRVDPQQCDALVVRTPASLEMRGRPMRG